MAINRNRIIAAARKYVDKGQLDKAIKEYQKIVQADPSDARVWLKIGDLYVKKGTLEPAIETYMRVATHYTDQGFYREAVAVYKQILRLNPRNITVYARLAELYRQRGLNTDALQQMEMLYRVLMAANRAKEALQVSREMIALDPENVALRIRLAEACSRGNMRREAMVEFTAACKLLWKDGRHEDYVKVAERLLWHDPDNLQVSKQVAMVYLQQREPRRALQKLQVCFKADPQNAETLDLLAEAFELLGQQAKSITILKELARVQVFKRQQDQAEEVYRRILALDPADADAAAGLDQLRQAAGAGLAGPTRTGTTKRKAASAVRPSASSRPKPALEESDEWEEISDIEVIEEVEAELEGEKEPLGEPERMLAETEAFAKYNLVDKAIEHLNDLLGKYPDHIDARHRLAQLLGEAGYLAKAAQEYLDLTDMLEEDEPERAVEYLEEGLGVDPENPQLAQRLADLKGEAVEDILSALELDQPGGEEDEWSELSGLQILEDIEAEAEALQPDFATQELSVEQIQTEDETGKRPSSGFVPAVTIKEDEPESLDDVAIIEDRPEEYDELIDLSVMSGIDEREGALRTDPFGGGLEPGAMATRPQADRAAAEGEADSEVDLAAVGEQMEGGADLDQQLADLESELGPLQNVDGQVTAERSTGRGDRSGKPIVVEEGLASDEEDALFLRPPEASEQEEGVSQPADEEFVDDELEQLQEAEALIASLKEAGGEDEEFAQQSAAAAEVDPDLDFSSLDEEGFSTAEMDAPTGPQGTVAETELTDAPSELEIPPETAESAEQEEEAAESEAEAAVEPRVDPEDELESEIEFEAEPEATQVEVVLPEQSEPEPASAPELSEEQIEALREEMAEADFFVDQQLFEDALEMLRELQERHGAHPVLMDRIAEILDMLKAEEAQAEQDGLDELEVETTTVDAAAARVQTDKERVEAADVEEASGVEPEEPAEPADQPSPQDLLEEPTQGLGARDAEIFEHFREGVARQVGEDDVETHFDLGIAYREMGMFNDAIQEFSKAMGSPQRQVQAYAMIATCYLTMGKMSEAIDEYKKALYAEKITEEEELDIYYQMGQAYEQLGDFQEALYYMEKVHKRQPEYRDVSSQLERLQEMAGQ